jgi:crotonobetainyl-CoA:carnitine CoA-transferase CaiB-like acyl-CoA transferase
VIAASSSVASAVLDERAALLGLPIAALGSVAPPAAGLFDLPVGAVRLDGRGAAPLSIAGALVVDLSALWAGPLCGQLLAAAGARVIKVESTGRPDGARRGPAAFFDLLNGGKRSLALDLASVPGRRQLRAVVGAADVVIESARPRALQQMGIDAHELLRGHPGPRVWASITSHGRGPGRCQRVGFGDVAAVAGGLVAGDEAAPCFLADAVADPLAGMVTAAAVLEALSAGGRWLLDAAMAPMAASVAGPPFVEVGGQRAGPPRARPVDRGAPALGSDTASVLRELLS